MYTSEEMEFFLEHGYLHVPGVLDADQLTRYRSAFDRVWEREQPKVNQHKLLKYRDFIDLIEHPEILSRQQAVFGDQTQLLQYDLLRQGPRSDAPARRWHRDFAFPGDRPLSVNSIVYMDDMTLERGPTCVVPGTHRGEAHPPPDRTHEHLPGEVEVTAAAGDVVFINGAVWHSGGANRSGRLRRGIFLYFGHWWMKRYEAETELPWQIFENASSLRLQLLGIRMPDRDLHMYNPQASIEGSS